MFGGDYFQARAQLAELATRVLSLAEKTAADQAPLTEDGMIEDLMSPYLFVACGEAGSGKSTLLNGVFGGDFCATDTLKNSDKINWFRYGEKGRDREVTPLMQECYRPLEFLKLFNLMDSPGTNVGNGEYSKVVSRFLPCCDLVFWVIPVTNPWGASLWDFISSQSEAVLRKSVIVLQQKDRCDTDELEIISGHVRDLAQQRLDYLPPMFVVSGRQAVKSKLPAIVDSELWSESGYPELEQFIADAVAQSPARLETLSSVRKGLTEVLRNIEASVEQRSRQLEGNENFLRDLEYEVNQERKRHASEFVVKFADMRAVFAGKNKEAKRYMRRKMGVLSTLKSLFLAENTSKAIESWLVDSIEVSVAAQADLDGEQLVEECRQHWKTVCPRVEQRLAIQLNDFDEVCDCFDGIREDFNKQMGASARQAVQNLRLRKALSPAVSRRQEHLKNCFYFVLLFLMASGVVGALNLPVPFLALELLVGAGLSFVMFTVRVRLTRKKISRSLAARLEKARIPFVRALEQDYQSGVRMFYVEYVNLLSSVRSHIFDAQQELAPNLEQRNRLFLELMILEREM